MFTTTPRAARNGFTLIEILIVIAIIALLAAILFPVFATTRERARQAACASNMKQIGFGIIQYTQDYDEKALDLDSGTKGWAGKLMPYIKSTQVFLCPSETSKTSGLGTMTAGGVVYSYNPVTYAYNMALRGKVIPPDVDGIPLSAFTDASRTVAVLEFELVKVPLLWPDEDYSWAHQGNSGGSYVAVMGLMDQKVGAGTSDDDDIRHKVGLGANYLFMDGHVKFLQGKKVSCGGEAVLPTDVQGLTTYNGSKRAEGAAYSGVGQHVATFSFR
jgi:prepilin-type N-terminal cleavage/methylation domain-containing protein/prepilin-type processing-associated H-X9-DG protein